MTRALAVALCLAVAACAPREWLLPKVGIDPPALREFPADFTPPISAETNQPMPGFGGGGGGVQRTPVIFIHGNTVSARYWLPARAHFLQAGYTRDELWSLGYGWDNVRYFDSNDLSVASVDRIVTSVMEHLSKKSGRRIHQVDIVAHSLGVTLVRQWMKQTNSWHKVRNFIGACGANDGVWAAWPDSRGQNRVVSFELAPNSPWLAQLNRGGETPGPTRYMTIYDGTGNYDVLFPPPFEHSSALEGAFNLAYNVERGGYYDHLELPREEGPLEAMLEFLRRAPEPLPMAEPPTLVRHGDTLRAEPAETRVHCTAGGDYPTLATPAETEVTLQAGKVTTCFVRDPRSELASPMARYVAGHAAPGSAPLTLRASPAGGIFEQPLTVTLKASDPAAAIVYTTGGGAVDSGSPLYTAPVHVMGPLRLSAVAIATDGRRSTPLTVEFDVSLEKVESMHTLQRQLDPATRERYEGRRKVGR
ncbi:MAG TPA: chitobiase/beta-hexosaminidase C-terminal domain-containing protein [Verrucomicrobiae bacterium]|nr:chitobiase/beta-hexosaminidase C-terminal domain-containing protein [Verrucomicrobiae bacterium]